MADIDFTKYGLGRNQSKLDVRDYKLGEFMPRLIMSDFAAPDTKWEFLSNPLNQFHFPHCVGFSMADFGITLPVQDNFTNQDGHDFYYKCKTADLEPNQENGSSVRTAAKVLKQEGLIDAYAFASSIPEVKWWLVNKGPLICGTAWTDSMFSVDENNIIHVIGDEIGGHAYVINEIKDNSLFGIQNSWGSDWGINGKAYISISDFSTLFRSGGEVLATVELSTRNTVQQGNGCITALINALLKIK